MYGRGFEYGDQTIIFASMKLADLKNYLDQTWSLLEKSEQNIEADPILKSNQPQEVRDNLSKKFPSEEAPFQSVLKDFETEVLPFLNRNTDARFGAYITGSGNRVAALAEFIKAFYNQNGLKWNNSPISSELEQVVIEWVSEFVKLPEHSKGFITSGGSMSNLMCIHLALADRYPDREMEGLIGSERFTVYCSNQTHSSVDRAMVFLGLGRNHLRKIGVNETYEIDLKELRTTIKEDVHQGLKPLVLIGNAGTTNTGSIDDLNELADIAQEFNLWYHVDGAYGLPARRLPQLAKLFDGVNRADSVIINPHKWMYVPFEASCVLVKSIPQAIHLTPDYLFTENPGERWESSTHTIELSKEFRALKIWFTMKYFGANQLTQFVQNDIDMADYLTERVGQLAHVKIEPHHPLSITSFRYENGELSEEENERINVEAIRQIESEGQIFITGTRLNGQTYLRVYFGNPERTKADVDLMIREIEKVLT